MSINLFTPEQKALIPEYQAKWQKIALSTERIDRERAKKSVIEACQILGQKEPEIIFCASPFEALERLNTYVEQTETIFDENIKTQEDINKKNIPWLIIKGIWQTFQTNQKAKQTVKTSIYALYNQISQEASEQFDRQVESSIPKDITTEEIVRESFVNAEPLFESLRNDEPTTSEAMKDFSESQEQQQESFRMTAEAVEKQLGWLPFKDKLFQGWLKQWLKGSLGSVVTGITGARYLEFRKIFYLNLSFKQQQFLLQNAPLFMPELAINCVWLDFAFSTLNYSHNQEEWEAWQKMVTECGSIFLMGNTYLICDRPTKILLNEKNQLHGDGETALEFSDGKGVWVYEGVPLQEKYSQINPREWRSRWVTEEKNKQLQTMLMKVIGALKISEDLPFQEKETIGEYTFLSLEGVGGIRTNILKRVNQETGQVKAEFIPWNENSLKQAVQYAHDHISGENFPLLEDEN